MDANRIKVTLLKEMERNFWTIMIVLLFFTIGIILGIYTVRYLQGSELQSLDSYLSLFISGIGEKNFSSRTLLMEAIRNNVIMILIVWCFGFTIFGIPIILMSNLIKGFSFGFALSFMIAFGGEKSVALSLAALVPQNIVYFLSMLIISIYAFRFSLEKVRAKLSKSAATIPTVSFSNYVYCLMAILLFMTIGFLLEAYVTPMALKLIVKG